MNTGFSSSPSSCPRTRACRSGKRAWIPAFAGMTASLLLLGSLSGCSTFGYQPVMPYEREALASPLMALSRDPVSDKYLQHVFETREGARGATGITGGGCGCN